MGFLLASMFGARYRVCEFGENETKTTYYLISTINNMWLADVRLEEIHHFLEPCADIVRLEQGPRTWSGIDKGRWFIVITDASLEQDNYIGYKKLYCKNEAMARGIYEDAERIRKQHEDSRISAMTRQEYVHYLLERSEKHLKELEAFQAEQNRRWTQEKRDRQRILWLERRAAQCSEEVVKAVRDEVCAMNARCVEIDTGSIDDHDGEQLQILLDASTRYIDPEPFAGEVWSKFVYAERYAIETMEMRESVSKGVVAIAIEQLEIALQSLTLTTSRREVRVL